MAVWVTNVRMVTAFAMSSTSLLAAFLTNLAEEKGVILVCKTVSRSRVPSAKG